MRQAAVVMAAITVLLQACSDAEDVLPRVDFSLDGPGLEERTYSSAGHQDTVSLELNSTYRFAVTVMDSVESEFVRMCVPWGTQLEFREIEPEPRFQVVEQMVAWCMTIYRPETSVPETLLVTGELFTGDRLGGPVVQWVDLEGYTKNTEGRGVVQSDLNLGLRVEPPASSAN